MTIGEKIKYYREQKQLTQEDVARFLKTTPQNIYKYEKGIVTNIPMKSVEALARLFETTPQALVGWDERNEAGSDGLNKAQREALDLIKSMSEEQLRVFIATAKAMLRG